MRAGCRYALKEWAVVVRALRNGRQAILLRKGGILDEESAFQLEHREFFLYPTFEHQHRKYVRPEYLAEFDQALGEQPPGEELILNACAEVADIAVALNLESLRHLAPFHVYNDDFLALRLSYKPDLPLHVLIVRSYVLDPVRLPAHASYRGCKSWVELEREFPASAAQPALEESEFQHRRQAILQCLGPSVR